MCLASHGSNEEHYEISLAFALHSAKLASVCVSMSWLTNKVWAANCLLAAGTGWLSINYSPSLNSWLAGLLYSLDSPCNILARTILCATVHIIPKPYNYIHFSFVYSYIFFATHFVLIWVSLFVADWQFSSNITSRRWLWHSLTAETSAIGQQMSQLSFYDNFVITCHVPISAFHQMCHIQKGVRIELV